MTYEEAKAAAEQLARLRQKARTDLAYLAGTILCYGTRKYIPGMKRVYQPVFDSMQKFKGGTDYYRVTEQGHIHHEGYKPACSMWELEGKRNTLVLIPRNHLKTTFCTIAHSIQWIINYPDVRIKLVAAKNDQVKGFLREIKEHFVSNPNLRSLFPEFCPKIQQSGKMEDFGNDEYMTVPCRTIQLKEPTVSILSEGSVMSSTHFEVLKPDDLVDHENSKTADRVAGVNAFVDMLQPLVERSPLDPNQRGWFDMTGTRYNFSDAYGRILQQHKEMGDSSTWNVIVRSAIYEEDGERKALWPERMSLKALDEERASTSSFAFSSQYLQSPIAEGQGLISKEEDLVFRKRDMLEALRPSLREYVTVDMASLEDVKHNRSDYTAILHAGWDRDGKLHMLDVRHGRFTESQFLDHLFDLATKNPNILYFKFQKDLISSTFMPVIQREMARRGIWFNIDWVSVAGRNKIQDRIQHLEPLYRQKQIIFYEPVSPSLNAEGNRLLKLRIVDELLKFPYFAHDDFLDAQSDFLMDRNEPGTDSMPEYGASSEHNPERPFGHLGKEQTTTPKDALHNHIFGNNEDSMMYEKSSVTGF